MSYADSCDFDSYCQFYAETFPRAQKEHSCCECSRKIELGELHLYCRGKNEDFWAERQCLECRDFCMEVRDTLMEGHSCLPFGGLDEFLSDSAGSIRKDLRKDRKKYERMRSMFAKWFWKSEKGNRPFWIPKKLPHREAYGFSAEWNLKRGLTLK